MVKVQNVGAVVGWIISIVWTIFLVVIITNYAHKSAFVRIIHTVLSPFHDVDMETCKYIAISICASNIFATQAWRYGIQNNKKHFTLWSMIWFSLILASLLVCIFMVEIREESEEEHPELIVILIVSIVFFAHLYIIAYVSFKTIKGQMRRTPLYELQSDSSYSIPLRSLQESNSVQTSLPSDCGYRSDDGDVRAPMFCISPAPSAPHHDGTNLSHQTRTIPAESHRSNSSDTRHFEPYRRIEPSNGRDSMDSDQPPKYSQLDQSHNKLTHT